MSGKIELSLNKPNASPTAGNSAGTDASTRIKTFSAPLHHSPETNVSAVRNASSRTGIEAVSDMDQTPRVDPPLNVYMRGSLEDGMAHLIYYRDQYTDTYKIDERVMGNIVINNVRCNNEKDKLTFIIYYRNSTITSLIMKMTSLLRAMIW